MSTGHGRTLDTRGSLCPQPIIDLAAIMADLTAGDELVVLSDDAAFPADVRAWCAGTGNELLALERDDRLYTATLRRRREAPGNPS